jgi:hypothetical protein
MRKLLMMLSLLIIPAVSIAQEMGNYLILNDIDGYKYRPKPTKRLYGNSGMLISADHFFIDHDDVTYETRYILPEPLLGAEVQVTQHVGGDSDRWLLHELERGIRRGDYEENMTPARFRGIENNNVFYSGLGGGTYRWLSGYVAINIEYVDLYREKSEPLEVVKAYLAKFPSTIPSMTIDRAHNEKWVKDEMERRLWLCDKWILQYQMGKVGLSESLRETVESMNVFLNYRERYYGIKAKDEKQMLAGYLYANNGTAIKSKLSDYKNWWNGNKTKSINVP